ncbi:hypothetical protein M9Y10_037346 [Tritrichomonas musculus]|uniref:Serine-threonine/tyrosine-protein kinase catalytic domain-containing protein n=1 Tax=Tritrichomonas musculus TaxID=1915356 RepID=A0ABR2GU01_9EUKA
MQIEGEIDISSFQIIDIINDGQYEKDLLIENSETKEKFIAKTIKTKCDSETDKNSFLLNIKVYLNVKYPALMPLIGFSFLDFDSHPYPTVIIDYSSNYSLQNYLNNKDQQSSISKFIILLGISLGMEYLCSNHISIGQLTTSNIFLDDHFFPKIDFFNFYNNINIETSNESNVYSLSMIAYELITGRRSPIDFSLIQGEMNQKFFKRCTSQNMIERPTIFEFCKFIVKKNFMTLFGDIDIEEVNSYFELFSDFDVALFLHGEMLFEEDEDKAIEYYKRSIEKGNSDAMKKYADIIYESNKEEAFKYYKMAVDKGNTSAMNIYAIMLYKGEGCESNKEEAINTYKEAIKKGNISSITTFADILYKDDNKPEAAYYFKMAADQGDDEAMFKYANMLRKGDGISFSKGRAVKYYKKAIDKGNIKAIETYAKMLEIGDCVPENKEESLYYYKLANEATVGKLSKTRNKDNNKAGSEKEEEASSLKSLADEGDVNAMFNYAVLVEKGDGIDANKEEAIKYYKMAIEKGDASAMNNYANMLYNGDGIDTNKEEAFKYYKMAVDKGDASAMNNYANMLYKGECVEANKEEAFKYYKMAINNGNENAIFNYAVMLEKGCGSHRADKEKAAYFYKLAADNGNVNAMFKYANMLENGEGVEENKEKAIYYYKIASNNSV